MCCLVVCLLCLCCCLNIVLIVGFGWLFRIGDCLLCLLDFGCLCYRLIVFDVVELTGCLCVVACCF